MSQYAIITEGFGSFGDFFVTQGFSTGATPFVPPAATEVGGGSRKRRHPEYVVWEEPEKAPDLSSFALPEKVVTAIRTVLDEAPPDDTIAIQALRSELHKLRVKYRPEYAQIVREKLKPVGFADFDEDDIEVLLLTH